MYLVMGRSFRMIFDPYMKKLTHMDLNQQYIESYEMEIDGIQMGVHSVFSLDGTSMYSQHVSREKMYPLQEGNLGEDDQLEIIKEGNSFKPVARTTTNEDGTSTITIPGAVTTEQKILKKNDLKARSILMMTLPSEHLLTFNKHKDAKSLFEAIEAIFGGTEATNKTQKALLKQIQLTILGEIITPEELNLKFLRSLPTEWGSQNLAFLSCHSSTNDVNTANVHVSTSSTPVSTASTNNSTTCLSDATIYAYLATQPNGSQVVHEDLEQIHEDDLDEMDLKWQLALLSMKARKFYQRTGKKIIINGSDTAGYDKKKVECFNCHKLGHFARECRKPRSQENRNRSQDSSRRTVNVEESYSKAMLAIDGTGFDWSYMADEEASTNFALMAFSDSEVQNNKTCSKTCLKNFEDLKSKYDKLRIELNKSESDLDSYKKGLASVKEQLVFYKKNESMLCNQIVVLKRDASFNESNINALKKHVERIKKEKEDNQFKIDNFENASKSLFAPPSIDLSNSRLEKFKHPEFEGYDVKINKGASENISKEVKKTSDAPITEDWVSDCDEDETVVLESLNVQKPKQADQPRKVIKRCIVGFDEDFDEDFDENFDDRMDGLLVVHNSPYFMVKSWLVQDQTVLALAIPGQTTTGYTLGSGEDSQKLIELMDLCTKLIDKVTIFENALKQSTESHSQTLTMLMKKVKRLEDKLKSIFEEEYRKLCLMLILLEAEDSEVCNITRANGSSSFHGDIQALLRRLDRQDLSQLYSLVQERFKDHPLEGHDLDLWGDLRMIFDPNEEEDIWLNQQY
ncbi:ribonuclease H-like domain-containing protein [Tanacetum coccineum]